MSQDLTNLLDPLNQVEAWKSTQQLQNDMASVKDIPLQQLRCQDKTLGISLSCPTKLSSSSSSTTNWMILAESNEYPTAQLRVAPTSAEAERTISIGVIIDDGFPVSCQSAEDALSRRKLAAAQEAVMAGGSLNVLKSEVQEEQGEAYGEWEMTSGHPGFPSLLVREKIRVWNGMSVSISVVGPRGKVASKDFDLVYVVATKTLNIDHKSLRLPSSSSSSSSESTSANNNSVQRLLIASHPMNCMLNVPFPRRVLLVDGSSQRPIQHHAAPALPGTVLTRLINPLTDVCISLIALPTQDLGEEVSISSSSNAKKTPHYTRQVRAHFHDGTSIAKIVEDDESGILTFTSIAVGVDHGRLCCAARPIAPRLGADPRMFLVLVASRLFDSQTPGAEDLVEKVMAPELVSMVSSENVFVSTLPIDIVGKPFKPYESGKKDIKKILTTASPPEQGFAPPACRYFILDGEPQQTGTNTNNTNNNNSQISSFSSLHMGLAVEFQMPCFAAGDNHYSCILTRCLWGEMIAVADGTGTQLVLRANMMKMMKNKTIDSLFYEAKYRAVSIDPSTTALTERNGSYEVLMVTPSEENAKMSAIKNGFHIGRSVGGDSSSCVFSVVVIMMNEQDQQENPLLQQIPPGMALS